MLPNTHWVILDEPAVTPQLIERIWAGAADELLAREGDQISDGVSERNLCSRLSHYLEAGARRAGLKGYYADAEYNRKQGGRIKTIINGKEKVVPITCDVILHRRGRVVKNDNLIAVEMKKAERPDPEKASDRDRLCALTKSSYDGVWSNDGRVHPEHVCGYLLGVYFELDRVSRKATTEYYVRGKLVQSSSRRF